MGPAPILPLCMAQVGGSDVWWAQAALAVIGRTSCVLMWASVVLTVATCSQAPALSAAKATLRLHNAVQVRSSRVCRLVRGICCLVAGLCL